MAWTPSASAEAAAATFRDYLADVSITAEDTAGPKALYDAFAGEIGGGHSLGPAVGWTAGTGAGQYSFGAALPNGVMVSIAGCDEGGTIAITTGINTNSGALFVLHFGVAFPAAPAGLVFAADTGTADLMFASKFWITTTTTTFTLSIANPPATATYTWHWIAKGST